MAFFEQLSKKVSQVSQTTIQKTKEIADIAKLNSSISEEEKRIESLYVQIGKFYITKYENEYREECKEWISSILEAEEKIQDYQKQIQEIKGVVHCPNCQAEVQGGLLFCGVCGAKVEKPKAKADTTGAEVSSGETKNNINAEETVLEGTVESSRKFCANCGAELKGDAFFCAECGTKVEK